MGMTRMGYPRELLDVANEVLYLAKPDNQATRRRAISTAYYALFHLLIDAACQLWTPAEQRTRLARQFDHRQMREVSSKNARRYTNSGLNPQADLYIVTRTFVQLQQHRHSADYDLSITFTADEVLYDVIAVEEAFTAWERISTEQAAQNYLFSLLFKERSELR